VTLAGAIADTTKAIEIDPRWIAAYISVAGDTLREKSRSRYGFCDFGKVAKSILKAAEDYRLREWRSSSRAKMTTLSLNTAVGSR